LGLFLARTGIMEAPFWQSLDRLNYFVCFPALLVTTIAEGEVRDPSLLPLLAAFVTAILFNAAVLTALRRPLVDRLGVSGPAYSSLFQGSVRWNGVLALALVIALAGPEGLTLAALIVGGSVPLLNLLSVMILTRYAGREPAGFGEVARLLVRNPLILGCLVGLVFNLTGLPQMALDALHLAGGAALTLGLLSVGAGLRFRALAEARGLFALSAFLKLLVLPLIAGALSALAGASPLEMTVVLVCAAVPAASSSYVLARQLGGDATLMAGIITAQGVLAILTLPLILAIFIP
ncbi:MAG: AEC family transporter, partial [Pseudomonadota bacterium]